LKELVDRKKAWDKVNGKTSNSNSEEDTKDDGAHNAPQWEFEDDETKPEPKPESSAQPTSTKEHSSKKRSERTKGERSDKRSHRREEDGRSERKKKEKRPERKEKPADPSKAKALRTIIHPSIEKVSKSVTDEKVLNALQELKSAFDVAEGIQPGTSHNFVAQIINALKKSSQQQQQQQQSH